MNRAFILARARPYGRELAIISGLSLLSSLATLALPWLAAQLAARLAGDVSIDLAGTLALLGGALVALTAVNILVAVRSADASSRILAGLRAEAYTHVQHLPVSYHDSHRTGDLLSLISWEVQNLSTFLATTLAQLPATLMTAGGTVGLLLLIDPRLGLVVPVLVPLFYIAMKLLRRRLRALGQAVRDAEAEVFYSAESDLQMLPAIKAYAVEDIHRARYVGKLDAARRLRLAEARLTAYIGPAAALVAALSAIALLLAGSGGGTERSPAELFAFLFYAALLTRPMGSLAGLYGSFQVARGTLARLEAVLAAPGEPGYAATGALGRAAGAIAFEAIDFAYPGRPPVLRRFDLSVRAGEVIALTGANGVGKSTLINLLLRFYEPDAGRITIDGTDIAQIDVQSLRRQFGYVPQRPLLLDDTIRENIVFGLADPAPGAIERAARLSQAWDFIGALPEGLDTRIGDDGVRLSGGQRQRIALARALLRDPPVYIFDEATSMYDIEGEAAFVEDCVKVLAERTVIIITHRPASLALADRIIEVTPEGWTLAGGTPAGGSG